MNKRDIVVLHVRTASPQRVRALVVLIFGNFTVLVVTVPPSHQAHSPTRSDPFIFALFRSVCVPVYRALAVFSYGDFPPIAQTFHCSSAPTSQWVLFCVISFSNLQS